MTTIRLKFTPGVYRVIFSITELLSRQVRVVDMQTLILQECLDKIFLNLNKQKYSKREYVYLSLSLTELFLFVNTVGTAMQSAGEYERAVWRDIEKNVDIQVNREVQIRMFK